MMHMGELVVIVCIGLGNLLFANYSTSYELYHRENMTEVSKYLLSAEKAGKPSEGNLISTRNIDNSISNTFAAGYCTYGAARISPEFFPYSGDTQLRTRGGNAIDRCENAQKTGFTIGSNARVGALVVYNPGNGIGSLGHVGKVMFYNNKTNYMIIRDMNRIIKGSMSDHWDNTSTANIKCFIYPNKTTLPETNNDNIPVVTPVVPVVTPVVIPVVIPVVPVITPEVIVIKTGSNTTISTGQHEAAPTPIIVPKEEPISTPTISENTRTIKNISLDLENISDISKNFMEQYEFTIKETNKIETKVGDTITLAITAKEKTTTTYYQGILPFLLNIISNNAKVSTNISRIQLFQKDETEISIRALEAGDTTIVILLDNETIAKIPVHITN
ncbi:MAG: CHAP domain-containing protein [Candidatus Absconditabacteria bacterium]